jgi:uncharacterized protein YecT (DUF1311 family)
LLLAFASPAFAVESPAAPDITGGPSGQPGQDETCNGGTYEIIECLSKLADKWDRRLNEAYKLALETAKPKQREKLRAAQRLWLRYREANCDYYSLGEGSMARIDAADCYQSMTAARARELEGDGN